MQNAASCAKRGRSELFSDNFLRNLAIQKTYEFVVRKSAYRYTFCVWPTFKKSDRPRVKNV